MVFRFIDRIIRTLRIRHHGSIRDESVSENDVKLVNDFPATCLRGLRKPNWVVDGQFVDTEAFIPNRKPTVPRHDGGLETSVNWEDNPSVERFTLSDKNIAPHGAARIATADIENTSRTVKVITKPLACERAAHPRNPYHGNIVYSASTPRIVEKQLAAALAMKSIVVSVPK